MRSRAVGHADQCPPRALPEAQSGNGNCADRSALRIVLHSEFDRTSHEGDAAGSESILWSKKAAEQHAVFGTELDTVDANLRLNLQRRFNPFSVQQPDAPLIHKHLDPVRCATSRTAGTGLHPIEEVVSVISQVLFLLHTSSLRSSEPTGSVVLYGRT